MNATDATPEPTPGPGPAATTRAYRPPTKTVRIRDDEVAPPAAHPPVQGAGGSAPLEQQYSVLSKIAEGGMGTVYLGRDHQLGRYVAIKRLTSAALSSPSLKQRFSREAKAIAALNHIHIVHVYAMGEDEQGPYIVMEYVPGPRESSPSQTPASPFTLADRVHRDGPLSAVDALDLMIKVCRAVDYAHQCRVIHRDLKPSNILLDESGEPKIADFGLARHAGAGDDKLTVPGEKMLSIGYGAPEQETDASLTDERSDVYGLGALFFFGITGQNPRYFRENDIPEALRMPIAKALEPEPNRRWPSVQEFTQALVLVKAPSTIELPTVRTTWRCKWCDTVNPVVIRYCGSCGWDGGEACLECGAEKRVGVQFCGVCGADAREYEQAAQLCEEIRDGRRRHDHTFVLQHTGRISGFHPVGDNGRQTAAEVRRMRGQAAEALKRQAELRELIERELADEDFENASRHIAEYETISADTPYAETVAELDRLVLERDLRRVRDAVEDRNWDYALRLCRNLLAGPQAPEETIDLLRRVRAHYAVRTLRHAVAAMLCILAVYLLSAAPVYRLLGRPRDGAYPIVYAYAEQLHETSFLQRPLELYARLWGAGDLYAEE